MIGTITWYYKDGRRMTSRQFSGTAKEITRHAKDGLAIYKNAGSASYEIVDEDGKAIG